MTEALDLGNAITKTAVKKSGKTTLALYVYRDERVNSCFDVLFWVSLTQDFDFKEVLTKILAYDDCQMPLNCNIDQLYHHFQRAIGGKKFLLVLDNIWDQHGFWQNWLDLRSLLELGAKGCKVLLTTRNQRVARMMDSDDKPYELGDLTKHDTWLLFQKIAFTKWQELGVREIGYDIAQRCPNVPLVIPSIGGVLAGKRTVQEWKAFRADQHAKSSISYGCDILHSLKLSYDQLDAGLKLCLASCSLFPKGFEYEKDEMVRLWISMECIKAQYVGQSLEEAAEAYMLNLIYCNFFKVERDYYEFFTMHDVMHDFVLSIVGFKYKMADSDTTEFDKRVLHVSFGTMTDKSWEVPDTFFKIEHLRPFLLAMPMHCKLTLKTLSICDNLRFKSLRVLDLHGLGIQVAPKSLCKLQSLRYLNLSCNPTEEFPESITQLVNLLSLDLSNCNMLPALHKNICNLQKLRHLKVKGCDKLSHMPKRLGQLTNLRTLDTFIAKEHNSQDKSKDSDAGGLEELNRLSNLMGMLTVRVFGRLKDAKMEDKAAGLKSIHKLVCLRLEFNDGSSKYDHEIINGLQPNENLRNLYINSYAGAQLPSWMRNQLHTWLPNLVVIHISNCEGCTCLCSFSRLPLLQILFLGMLKNVEYIEDTCSCSTAYNPQHIGKPLGSLFPSLEELVLLGMPNLKAWYRISTNDEEASQRSLQDNLLEPKRAFPKLKKLAVDNVKMIIPIQREFIGQFLLEKLTIANCEDLKTIPEWIANLTSLKRLTLYNCSKELEERCRKPTGKDWSKIQHIHCIHINPVNALRKNVLLFLVNHIHSVGL